MPPKKKSAKKKDIKVPVGRPRKNLGTRSLTNYAAAGLPASITGISGQVAIATRICLDMA